jgi:hypothetical protein
MCLQRTSIALVVAALLWGAARPMNDGLSLAASGQPTQDKTQDLSVEQARLAMHQAGARYFELCAKDQQRTVEVAEAEQAYRRARELYDQLRAKLAPDRRTAGPASLRVAVMPAFVPKDPTEFIPGEPIPAEQLVWEWLGSRAHDGRLDRILMANSPDDMFAQLAKLTKDGRTIRYLIIVGHSTMTEPMISFKKRMREADVDVAGRSQEFAARHENILKLRAKRCALQHEPKPTSADLTELVLLEPQLKDEEAKYEHEWTQLRDIEEVAASMEVDAQVLLINCWAASTPRHVAFAKGVGRLFLHKDGGYLIASETAVAVLQALTVAETIRAKELAGHTLEGKWTFHPIAPERKPLFPFLHVSLPAPCLDAIEGETVSLEPKWEAIRDSGKLTWVWEVDGQRSTGPPSLAVPTTGRVGQVIRIAVGARDERGRIGNTVLRIFVVPRPSANVAISTVRLMPRFFNGEQVAGPGLLRMRHSWTAPPARLKVGDHLRLDLKIEQIEKDWPKEGELKANWVTGVMVSGGKAGIDEFVLDKEGTPRKPTGPEYSPLYAPPALSMDGAVAGSKTEVRDGKYVEVWLESQTTSVDRVVPDRLPKPDGSLPKQPAERGELLLLTIWATGLSGRAYVDVNYLYRYDPDAADGPAWVLVREWSNNLGDFQTPDGSVRCAYEAPKSG